jgi:uncharacterized protein
MYNISCPASNPRLPWVVANSYTGCIIHADNELYDFLGNFSSTQYNDLRETNDNLANYLFDKGFVVNDDLDELARVRVRFQYRKYNDRCMNLTILPTSNCNLACIYCYEEPKKDRLDTITIEKIKKYVGDRAGKLDALSVTWYGGEPLLEFDTIGELSSYFTATCEKNGIEYSANMVSNGTRLTREKVKLLKSWSVNRLQITIDGPEHIHNARRPYKSGKKNSFADIIKGLEYCKGHIPVGIRVNIDRTNIQYYKEFVDYLHGKRLIGPGSKNSIAFGIIKKWTDSVLVDNKSLLSLEEFYKLRVALQSYLEKQAISSNGTFKLEPTVPCSAIDIANVLIAPDGTLKKCWAHSTAEDIAVGDLQNGVDFNLHPTIEWTAYDPTYNSDCAKCNILPVCTGGCPYEMIYKPSEKKKFCRYKRSSLIENLSKAKKRKE